MNKNNSQDTQLLESAKELVERLGSETVTYLQDRIAKTAKGGSSGRDLDQTYRLLTEVERLLKKET